MERGEWKEREGNWRKTILHMRVRVVESNYDCQSILLSLQVLLYKSLLFFEVINNQAKDKLYIKFLAVLLWKPSVTLASF